MTNQSVTKFFIILAIMSASLFFYQVEKLNKLESQSTISQNKTNHSIKDFHRYSSKYQQAVKVKNSSDLMRGTLSFILSPFSSIINIFLDNVTDIEKEANQTIQSASELINLYQNIIQNAGEIQQQRIEQIISWRNIGLIMCLFSVIASLFTRASQSPKPAELLTVKPQTIYISKAVITIIAGSIISCIPSLEGLAFKLVIPSIVITYFIVHRQFQNEQISWQKRTVSTIAFSLLVSLINYGFYAWQGISIEFVISGFIFGLFIATSIQHVLLPLTTRQFFAIALVFAISRLVAVLTATEFGSEFTVLEGLLSISGLLWIIQIHAIWIKPLKFDVLVGWFTVHSIITFIFGNYYQTALIELAICYMTVSTTTGAFLIYHLYKTHKKNYLSVGIEDKGNLSQLVLQNK